MSILKKDWGRWRVWWRPNSKRSRMHRYTLGLNIYFEYHYILFVHIGYHVHQGTLLWNHRSGRQIHEDGGSEPHGWWQTTYIYVSYRKDDLQGCVGIHQGLTKPIGYEQTHPRYRILCSPYKDPTICTVNLQRTITTNQSTGYEHDPEHQPMSWLGQKVDRIKDLIDLLSWIPSSQLKRPSNWRSKVLCFSIRNGMNPPLIQFLDGSRRSCLRTSHGSNVFTTNTDMMCDAFRDMIRSQIYRHYDPSGLPTSMEYANVYIDRITRPYTGPVCNTVVGLSRDPYRYHGKR